MIARESMYSSANVYAMKDIRKWYGEGYYIVDAQTPSGWMCVDVMRAYDSFGRYIITVVP